MMNPNTKIPTAETLRGEQRTVREQLASAQKEWEKLGDDPTSFVRRANLAASIADLRAADEGLSYRLEAAERQRVALMILREQEVELRDLAVANVTALIQQLPSREEMHDILTLASQADALSAVITAHEGVPLRSMNATKTLKTAFEQCLSSLQRLLRTGAIRPDLSMFDEELEWLKPQKGLV